MQLRVPKPVLHNNLYKYDFIKANRKFIGKEEIGTVEGFISDGNIKLLKLRVRLNCDVMSSR